jgi:hypothetical protein
MPGIFRAIGDEFNNRFRQKETVPVNAFAGFQSNGAVVLRDRWVHAQYSAPRLGNPLKGVWGVLPRSSVARQRRPYSPVSASSDTPSKGSIAMLAKNQLAGSLGPYLCRCGEGRETSFPCGNSHAHLLKVVMPLVHADDASEDPGLMVQ